MAPRTVLLTDNASFTLRLVYVWIMSAAPSYDSVSVNLGTHIAALLCPGPLITETAAALFQRRNIQISLQSSLCGDPCCVS